MNSDEINDEALAARFRLSPEQEAINAAAWRETQRSIYGPSGRPPPRQRYGETAEEFQARVQGLPHPQAEARAQAQAQARARLQARAQALAQPVEESQTTQYKGDDINGGKKSRSRRRRHRHRSRSTRRRRLTHRHRSRSTRRHSTRHRKLL